MLIKIIKFTIKFKIFYFHYPHIPLCNFQNSVSEKMWCCLTFVCVYISFEEYVSKVITHLVIYGELIYRLIRVKGTANFISSVLNILVVKWLRCHQYDPVIIKRTIALVLGLCTDRSQSFALWITRLWGLYDEPCPDINSQRRLGPDPHPLWLYSPVT